MRYVTYSKDQAVVERYLDPSTQIRYFSFKDSWETSLSRKAQINLATGESNLKGIPQLLGERELQQGTASTPCVTAEPPALAPLSQAGTPSQLPRKLGPRLLCLLMHLRCSRQLLRAGAPRAA